jgi:hypothetical protein
MDEQAVLTVASYCKLFDHFTGLQVYRLRSHVRKSVPGVGQAELDAIDVGVALRDDEMPILGPRFRWGSLRTLRVLVPKASMDEYYLSSSRHDDVRLAW